VLACPLCRHYHSRVLETEAGGRRRRKCSDCGHRWTTYEVDKLELERLRTIERKLHEATELTRFDGDRSVTTLAGVARAESDC